MNDKLSKNFSRHEFECECGCGFDTVDYGLIDMLQDSVDFFENEYNEKVKVEITGGNRCKKHNEVVQLEANPNYIPYSSESTHMDAKAADHKHYYLKDGEWIQIEPKKVYEYYDKKYPTSKGIGLYNNRVHADSRENKARWGK